MTPTEFREARLALGLTQAELAESMGMERRAIIQIESGAAKLRTVHVLAMRWLTFAHAAKCGKVGA